MLDTDKQNGKGNDYLILVLLAYSGLRSGELLALKWSDVDFTEGTFSITKMMYNSSNNKDYTLLTSKTKGSIRTIKTDADVMGLLEHHRSKQLELKNKWVRSLRTKILFSQNQMVTPSITMLFRGK